MFHLGPTARATSAVDNKAKMMNAPNAMSAAALLFGSIVVSGQYQLHSRRAPEPLPFVRKPPQPETGTGVSAVQAAGAKH
jgi:hypothetical protein